MKPLTLLGAALYLYHEENLFDSCSFDFSAIFNGAKKPFITG